MSRVSTALVLNKLVLQCRGSKVFPAFVAVIKSPEGDDSKIGPLKEVRYIASNLLVAATTIFDALQLQSALPSPDMIVMV